MGHERVRRTPVRSRFDFGLPGECRVRHVPAGGAAGCRFSLRGAIRAYGERAMRRRERGQSLVEGTLVFLVFCSLLLGVIDCGQVVFAHQSLVERVRTAVRWGTVHPWEGPDRVVNLILYNQTDEPRASTEGFLGLKAANVAVSYRPPTAD